MHEKNRFQTAGNVIRTLILSIFLSAASIAAHAQDGAQTGELREYSIQGGVLSQALDQFAEQNGLQIIYDTMLVAGKNAPTIEGRFQPEDVLDRLLSDSGLEYEYVNDNTLVLSEAASAPGAAATPIVDENGITQPWKGVEEIIVTGQKRAERLQDVPIAISAFSQEDLEAQKIEGGFDLLKAVPNVTFSKTNFTGYNFQIRGIGTQAISATTDPGVAVSMNNTTLIVNRLFEQEYLDIERVEVLRGPQGTLYGRNATGGVINVITQKPELGVLDGMIDVEVGNFNTRRLRGHFNLPIGDTLALRGAYASTKRDGYATNEFDGSAIDGRDLWTARLSLGWQPTDRFRADFMWERFEEDDDRLRSAKNLCHRDEGPDQIGDTVINGKQEVTIRRVVQQGCLPGSLYSDGAFDTPNGDAHPFITVGRDSSSIIFAFTGGLIGYVGGFNSGPPPAERPPGSVRVNLFTDAEVYADPRQSRDLRTIYSPIEPQYKAKADLYEFSFDYQWTDALTLKSNTVYVEDDLLSTQDFTRYEASPGLFSDIGGADGPPVQPMYADFAPDGVFCDPQLGCSSAFLAQDLSQSESTQFNQQFELGSDFSGPWNFHLGVNYTQFETTADYFYFSNALTALGQTPPFTGAAFGGVRPRCSTLGVACISIQEGSLNEVAADPQGHNFFLSRNPYELESVGVFGESYWQPTDTLKVTLGLRMTWDRKVFTPTPSQTLLPDYREVGANNIEVIGDPRLGPEACNFGGLCLAAGNAPGGIGYPTDPDIVQTWREPTGRLVVDWQPVVGFTDETMIYASFARGYKGGGANPPAIASPAGIYIKEAQGAVAAPTFEPEFVNAYEIGTKNTLFGGAATLNLTAFYYDYTDYQVSKIVDRSAVNENFDAKVWGLELESIFAPTLNWQFNAAIGYLQTKIAEGERSIDLMDRTQGGNQFQVTLIPNPAWDPDAEQLAREDFVAGTTAPAGQQFLAFDDWVVLKPNAAQSSNCVAPADLVGPELAAQSSAGGVVERANRFCPGGSILGNRGAPLGYLAITDAPNAGAGFFDDIGGNELPNAPEFTVSLGGQYNFDLTRDWRATARLDYYWQDKSFARVYNTEYDRLRSWSNTNLSFWINNPVNGITVEAYVKNVFDETPITGTFLNSDDTALTTNVFTLDPRLIGVSIRKEF